MKRIGFLSFGHWSETPYSQVRSASDALLQSIELAVAAEELGADDAYFRVHHFAQQLGSPFPLLAAQQGMNLQSSTLVFDESGEPLHVQQRRQIDAYRAAWTEAGHAREPRVSVSRSIFAIVDDRDRAYFGRSGQDHVVSSGVPTAVPGAPFVLLRAAWARGPSARMADSAYPRSR